MRRRLMIIGILIFAVSTAFAYWSGTDGDLKVSYFPGTTGDYLSRFPRVIPGGVGTLYAVWVQGKTFVPYEVFFSKSTDNGRTWSGSTADREISANDGEGTLVSTDHPVDIAVWDQDHLCVVWAESLTDAGFEVMLVKSDDGGDTWDHSNADFAISFPGGDHRALAPTIAVDHDGGLHVVWHQAADIGSTEIFYGYSSDGGETWTSQTADRIISFPDGSNATYPDITVDADDNVYVAWTERIDPADITTTAVHYGIKLAGDSEFSSETEDLTAAMPHRSTTVPSIAIGPDFGIHIAYEARNDIGGSFKGAIYYTQSMDGGSTWSGNSQEVYVDYNPFDDSSSTVPTMVVTSDGNLAVCFDHWDLDGNSTQPRVSLSTDNGVTWSGHTQEEIVSHWEPSPDNRPGYNPHMCVSVGDTLHVVWNEDCNDEGGSAGYYEIMYSRGDVLGTSGPIYDYVVGDYNGSGAFNVADIVDSFSKLKTGSPDPAQPMECPPGSGIVWAVAMDVNNSCSFNVADVVTGFSYLKTGSPGPLPCEDCPPGL